MKEIRKQFLKRLGAYITVTALGLILQFSLAKVVEAETSGRTKENFNYDWKYHKGDVQGAEAPGYNDVTWESVVLPHTFENTDYMANNWYRGAGWYRKELKLKPEDANKIINLYFEGAKTKTEIWINGVKLDTHIAGFTPFMYNITDYVQVDKVNTIAIKVDNSYQGQVAPEKPDGSYVGFNMFGGIYRDVHLIKTEKLYVPEAIHDWNNNWKDNGGTFVSSSNVTKESADVKLQTWVKNANAAPVNAVIISNILGEDGQILKTVENNVEILPGQVKELIQETKLQNPKLWSIRNPNLYELQTIVKQGNHIVDEYSTTFGIRSAVFTKNEGFFLNGENLKILGVNHHQDWPYIGDAAPNNLQRQDVKLIKDSGSNFVRQAHYLYDDAFMDAADELGIMQWVEIPGWGNISAQAYAQYSNEWKESNVNALINTIRTSRNHPSIVIWGAGINEMPQHDKPLEQRLHNTAKAEDPSRPTSSGRNYNTNDNIFDVYGRNIYTEQEWVNAGLHLGAPDPNSMGLINTEHTGHTFETWRNASEERLVEHALRIQKMTSLGRDQKYVHGSIVWEMHDHHHQISIVRPHGLTDAGRIPKFAYYWYKSQSADVNYDGSVNPMVFIANYWRPESPTKVIVFSNADKVRFSKWNETAGEWEAFATKGPEAINVAHPHFEFDAVKHDTKKIKAEGIINGEIVATHVVEEPGAPSQIDLVTAIPKIDGNASDVSIIEFFIKDKNGTVIPYSTNPVEFEITGPGELIGGPAVNAVNGANIILVKSTGAPGTINVTAKSVGLTSDSIAVTAADVGINMPQASIKLKETANIAPGKETDIRVTFSNTGSQPLEDVNLTLQLPSDWTIVSETSNFYNRVEVGEEVEAVIRVKTPSGISSGKGTVIAVGQFSLDHQTHKIANSMDVVISNNLALFREVKASTEEMKSPIFNPASNANDGSKSTRWAASSGSLPQWWQVNLGTVQEMNQVQIAFNQQTNRTYTYDVEISSDNKNFTKIIENETSNPIGDTIVTFAKREAQFVKVSIKGVNPSNWWASISEVEIYNK